MNGRGALIIVIIIALAIASIFIVPLLYQILFFNSPGNPPVTTLTGDNDVVYSDENVVLHTQIEVAYVDQSILYRTFSTDGQSVYLYGNFSSNYNVRFFITDNTGIQEIRNNGYTTRVAVNYDDVTGFPYEYLLAPYQNGSFVSTWYVVISVFGYPYGELDRSVNYHMCQDKTAPSFDMEIPKQSKGMVKINITSSDIYRYIQEIEIRANGSLIYSNSNVNLRSTSFTISWNTTTLPDGYYIITAYVTDDIGNGFTYEWETVIVNQEPPPLDPFEDLISITVSIVSIGLGSIAIIIVLRSRLEGHPTTILFLLATASGAILLSDNVLEWHELFGLIADILGVSAFIGGLGKWIYEKWQKRKATPKFRPELYQ